MDSSDAVSVTKVLKLHILERKGSTLVKLILISCGIGIRSFNLYDKSPETLWELRYWGLSS
jgi:hypothetical protein